VPPPGAPAAGPADAPPGAPAAGPADAPPGAPAAGPADATPGPAVADVPGRLAAQPGYGIGALARRLGIAPATLRDWERRYGIGPGGRTEGGHRRYQPADVARIEFMRRLILDGVPPGEAARVALATDAAPAPHGGSGAAGPGSAASGASWSGAAGSGSAGSGAAGSGSAGSGAAGSGADWSGAAGSGADWSGAAGRGAGGRSLPLHDGQREARGLARAALALDGPAIARALRRSLDERGAAATWERLAVPVLTAVGDRSAANGTCVDVEHLLSAQLVAALGERAGGLAEPRNARTVLLACADGEQHSLPLYALAASLAELRVGTTMLGARVPSAALAGAVSRIGPAAAFVWSQMAETGDPVQLAGIPRQRPPLRMFLAGPGWRDAAPGTRQVTTLAEAVQQACEAVGAA
jgi:MerR HTH family regulatory protein